MSINIPEDGLKRLEAALDKTGDAKPGPGTKLPRPSLDGLDFEPSMAHLYEKAELEVGQKDDIIWFVPIEEWRTETKAPGRASKDIPLDKDGTPRNLGDFITAVVNSGESWRVFNVLPNGYGSVAVVFLRKYKMVLPTPVPLSTPEVAAPTTEELKDVEARTAAWVKDQSDLAESLPIDGDVEGR